MTLFQEVAYYPSVPKDWYNLAKAYCTGAEFNRVADCPPPPTHINSHRLSDANWYRGRLLLGSNKPRLRLCIENKLNKQAWRPGPSYRRDL